MGVENLEWFNLALVGKWAWRILMGGNALWSQVLYSKYGDFSRVVEETRRGKEWGKGWSSWWMDLVKIVSCKGWFWKNMRKKLGDGSTTRFWEDGWGGNGVCLRVVYPRLFSLDMSKWCCVNYKVTRSEFRLVYRWNWRRKLFTWEEEMVAELEDLLNRTLLLSNAPDCWVWIGNNTGSFTRVALRSWQNMKLQSWLI